MENRREFCMVVAHYLMARNGGRPVAMSVIITNNTPSCTGFSLSTAVTRWDTRTAVVNLLQSASENGVRVGNELYTTEMPTQACIGIAKAQGVRYLFFVYNGQLCYIDTSVTPVPTVHARQIVQLNVRPPGAERLNPSLPNLVWLPLSASGAANAALAWFNALPAYAPGTRSRNAVDQVALIGGAPLVPVAPNNTFRMAAPTGSVPGATPAFRDRLFMSLVRVIAVRAWQHSAGGPDMRSALPGASLAAGKNIAAIIVNQNNQIIAWGLNTNDNATTRHAETNAIQAFQDNQGLSLPAGSRIYSSLDPCFMCAALYVRAGGHFCLYEQADPNMTGNTALGADAVQYHESFSGPLNAPVSVAQTLDAGYLASQAPRVPDYLRTDNALHVYSFAHERLATTGLRAATAGDRQLFQNVMGFLRDTAFLGEIGQHPELFLDDDVLTRRL